MATQNFHFNTGGVAFNTNKKLYNALERVKINNGSPEITTKILTLCEECQQGPLITPGVLTLTP